MICRKVRIKHYKQTDRPYKKVIIFRDTHTNSQTLHHNIYINININIDININININIKY